MIFADFVKATRSYGQGDEDDVSHECVPPHQRSIAS